MRYPPRAVTVTRLAELAQATCPSFAPQPNGQPPPVCGCAKVAEAAPLDEDPMNAGLGPTKIVREARGCAAARGAAMLLAKLSDGEYAALVRRVGGVLA